ncbi:MAG: MFS transporter [Candidatus Odinarchaeota archaeon]
MSTKDASKINIFLWTTYDIANTVFSMGIVSMTVLQFITILGMQEGMSYSTANFLASLGVSVSNLIVAISIPIMGSLADNAGKGKPGTIVMGALTILFTGFVYLFMNTTIALILFIIANITYQWGNLFYDTMIPRICSERQIGWVSAVGVALGYFGSFVGIGFGLLLPGVLGENVELPDNIGDIDAHPLSSYPNLLGENPLGYLRDMWLWCAVAFLLIALPFFFTRERAGESRTALSLKDRITQPFAETWTTAKEIWHYPDMKWYILGWLLTVDVVNTVIAVMKKTAEEGFRLSSTEATILLGIGVLAAVILTGITGPIVDRKGPKFTFILIAAVWTVALFIPIFTWVDAPVPGFLSFLPQFMLFIMAVLVGYGMGSTWVAGRSMTIELAPEDAVGRYFGFSRLAGKGASAFGILIFGSIVSVLAELTLPLAEQPSIAYAYKIAIIALLIMYALGFLCFLKIKDHHKEFLAGKRAPYD